MPSEPSGAERSALNEDYLKHDSVCDCRCVQMPIPVQACRTTPPRSSRLWGAASLDISPVGADGGVQASSPVPAGRSPDSTP